MSLLFVLLTIASCVTSFVLDLGKHQDITIPKNELKLSNIRKEYVDFSLADKKANGGQVSAFDGELKLKNVIKDSKSWTKTYLEDDKVNVYGLDSKELFALKEYTDDSTFCKHCRFYWRNDVEPPHKPLQFASALYYGTHSPKRGILWENGNLVTYMGMNGAELPNGVKEGELVNGGKDFFYGPWSTSKDLVINIATGFAERGTSPLYIIYKIEIPKGHDVKKEPGAIDVSWFSKSDQESEVTMYNIPCEFVTYYKVKANIQQFTGGAHKSYYDMIYDIYYDLETEEARERKEKARERKEKAREKRKYRLIAKHLHTAQKERARELGYVN